MITILKEGKNGVSKRHYQNIVIIFVLFCLAVFSFVISLCAGAIPIGFNDIVSSLFYNDESVYRTVIFDFRLPRTLVSLCVAICLALSGCILQGIMRNSLASPGIIGVTSGASFAGYLILVVFPNLYYLLPIGSIIGAFGTTLLIYVLAYSRGVSPMRMILSGTAVSALFGAFIDVIRTFFSDKVENVQGFLVGGLSHVTWTEFNMIALVTLASVIVSLLIANQMNILMLGDESANSLGLPVERFRLFLIVISSIMSGVAVAVAGIIGFVGLLVPHISRLLVGSDYKYLFPASIFMSAALMTLCDSLGRVIMHPGEMPVGVIMSFIGAPFFLYLLRAKFR